MIQIGTPKSYHVFSKEVPLMHNSFAFRRSALQIRILACELSRRRRAGQNVFFDQSQNQVLEKRGTRWYFGYHTREPLVERSYEGQTSISGAHPV
jgi:hypothetical protein